MSCDAGEGGPLSSSVVEGDEASDLIFLGTLKGEGDLDFPLDDVGVEDRLFVLVAPSILLLGEAGTDDMASFVAPPLSIAGGPDCCFLSFFCLFHSSRNAL